MILRNLLIWFGLFALAFFNGAIREVGIKRWVREPWAHHISALTAVVLFTIYVGLIWNRTGIKTSRDAVLIGAIWLILTVLTETFVLGRWMSRLSWEQILQSYNLFQGGLWPLVVIWIGILPVMMLLWKK